MVINDQYTHQGRVCKMSSPLWYDSRMIPDRIEQWVQKCVTTIGDNDAERYSVFYRLVAVCIGSTYSLSTAYTH